jgi:hypothetical protein
LNSSSSSSNSSSSSSTLLLCANHDRLCTGNSIKIFPHSRIHKPQCVVLLYHAPQWRTYDVVLLWHHHHQPQKIQPVSQTVATPMTRNTEPPHHMMPTAFQSVHHAVQHHSQPQRRAAMA